MAARHIAMVATRVCAGGIQAASLVLLARDLGPEPFAVVGSGMAIGAFLSLLFDFGVSSWVLRERVRDPRSSLVANSLRYSMWAGLAVAALSGAFMAFLGVPSSLWISMLLLAIWMGFERVCEFFHAVAVADGREVPVALMLGLRRLPPLCAVAFPFAVGEVSLVAFSSVSVAGSLGALAYGAVRLGRTLGSTSRPLASFKTVVQNSLPFWISSTSSQSRELESVAAQALAPAMVAGQYALVMRIARPISMLATSVAQVALPAAASIGRVHARRACAWVLMVGVAISAAGLCLVPALPWLMDILLGTEFQQTAPLMAIVLVSAGLASVAPPIGSIAQGQGLEKGVAVVGVVTAVVSLGWACLALVTWGGVVALAGTSVAYSLKSIALTLLVTRGARELALSAGQGQRSVNADHA